MTKPTLILGDKNPELIDEWEKYFQGLDDIKVRGGNLLMVKADALVSPANSFGFMDGGIDWSISELMEWKIQPLVQEVIRKSHAGELLVGQAIIVKTGRAQFLHLVCAPTMRVPQDVSSSTNAFLAMRAILLAVRQFNQSGGALESVAIPGLCTGVGRMPYARCAHQMRMAYDEVYGLLSNKFDSLKEAIEIEKQMKI